MPDADVPAALPAQIAETAQKRTNGSHQMKCTKQSLAVGGRVPRGGGGIAAVLEEAVVGRAEAGERRVRRAKPVANCIKIGLPGKSIFRDYFQENRTSVRPFLLLRISFPGRPIFILFIPAQVRVHRGGRGGGGGRAGRSAAAHADSTAAGDPATKRRRSAEEGVEYFF